jgi:hypothetical protein
MIKNVVTKYPNDKLEFIKIQLFMYIYLEDVLSTKSIVLTELVMHRKNFGSVNQYW